MSTVTAQKSPPQYDTRSLQARVGNTPLLPLDRIAADFPVGVKLYGKAEWFNPTGSVKDRPALAIIQRAFASGELSSKRILLDSTSGNMGIAYASFAASLGIRVTLAVPENASHERQTMLKALGAELILTDPLEGADGAREVASELAAKFPRRYYHADQYSNPANSESHYATTGPEIVRQTQGRVTHFVAGLGTTGTLMGTGRYLKENIPGVHLVAVQPEGPFHGLEGLKHLETSHVPSIYDPSLIDAVVGVSTEEAYAMTLRLAREEGILVGISAAAAAIGALRVAQRVNSAEIVALFPDSALKYLGEPYWSQT